VRSIDVGVPTKLRVLADKTVCNYETGLSRPSTVTPATARSTPSPVENRLGCLAGFRSHQLTRVQLAECSEPHRAVASHTNAVRTGVNELELWSDVNFGAWKQGDLTGGRVVTNECLEGPTLLY